MQQEAPPDEPDDGAYEPPNVSVPAVTPNASIEVERPSTPPQPVEGISQCPVSL